jgi:antigen flippase
MCALSRHYASLIRSSAITASASVAVMLVGLVATKVFAHLLGPAGLGELRTFQALLIFLGYLVGLGTGNSALVAMSAVHGKGEEVEFGRLSRLFRRWSLVYGAAGAMVVAALSGPVSAVVFGSDSRAPQVALLGVALFISAMQAGWTLQLQARRQIAAGAILMLIGSMASSAVLVLVIWIFGVDGIIAGIIGANAATFALFRVFVSPPPVAPPSPVRAAVRQVAMWSKFGMSSLWVDAITQAGAFAITTLVIRELGMETNGIYLAAWGLSGMVAGFVLSSMGVDFLPRLSACGGDKPSIVRLINQQVEVGILLATPGIVALMAFSPLAISFIYSNDFSAAAEPLRWFLIHSLLRVVSFPIYISFPANAAGRQMVIIQLTTQVIQVGAAIAGIHFGGLNGLAVGIALSGVATLTVFSRAASTQFGFRPSSGVTRLACASMCLVSLAFVSSRWSPGLAWQWFFGGGVVLIASIMAVRGLAVRLGRDHRAVRWLQLVPLSARLLRLPEAWNS